MIFSRRPASSELTSERLPGSAKPPKKSRREDINKELAEIGLSEKSGWLMSIVLYAIGGSLVVAIYLISPGTLPDRVLAMGIVALCFSAFCVFGYRFLAAEEWGAHLRLCTAVGVLSTGAILGGASVQSFSLLMVFLFMAPCFVYGSRWAVPYSLASIAIVIYLMFVMVTPNTTAHAVITVGVVVMIIASMMVSEQRTRSLARQNRRLAYTDALTGIANTRKLREELTDHLKGPVERSDEFALFAMDLDNFKLVNDVFDHTMGDNVLKAVAAEIEAELEPDDMAVRRGGDEFSVLVTAPQGRDLDHLCERLSGAITRARRQVCPEITPSGSVAYVLSRSDDTLSSVLQRADDELHMVKRAFHNEHGEREAIMAGISVEELSEQHRERQSAVKEKPTIEPARPGLIVRTLASFREGMLRFNPLWGFASFTFIPIGLVVGTLALLGQLQPLTPLEGGLINAAILALGIGSFVIGRRQVPVAWIHVVFAPAVALYFVELALAGVAGSALFDISAALMLYGFYFFRARVAFPYFALIAGGSGAFAITGQYPDWGVHVGLNTVVMLAAAGLVVKVNTITVGFARANRDLAQIDALTGLYNVRALRGRVTEALAKDHGDRRPALLSIDLDRFKLVNDTFNHTIGDQVLVAVARAISETARAEDIVARRGGDEYFVLCMAATPDEIDHVAQRLSASITHARRRICPDLPPTASIAGVLAEPGESAELLIHRADVALHDAKTERRESGYAIASA